MRLADLMAAAGLAAPASGGGAQVTGFAIDNRKVAPGNVFGAFAGATVNGEDFIPQAVAAGAIAVVAAPGAPCADVPLIADAAPRRAFARLAAPFYAPFPDTIVAVTGTNGKTSTVEMLRQIWRMGGHRAASIGTLGITTPDETTYTGLTTPDIVTFLGNLAGLAKEGVSHVAYEASSHGLSQYRNEGPRVCAGAFTNLSRDHLDYHATMEDYFAAKMRLFTQVVADEGAAVIWADDEWSDRAIAVAQDRGLKVMTVGAGGDAIRLISATPGHLGQALVLVVDGAEYRITLPLIGAYQVANALVAAGLALASGLPASQVIDALTRLQPVRGRLERACLNRAGAAAYVDYAHTPDALAAAIAALRPHLGSDKGPEGRLIVVFGAGGDRDAGKRPDMGRIAADMADVAIIADDNPRGEDAAAIRAAIRAGMGDARAQVHEIGDRREAIAAAMRMAQAGDVILIAGKGHEQGQIIGRGADARVLPFDDCVVARQCAGETA
ncbi:UDP-N-acetylmuramoyl-L-alanyl-D-glutamate--2,6-diaminopimelate ligase [Novosphingobium sp. FSY-8]|uniref:UDP-N-acetylmuramoyl-L-alanyl-D-glutamate--2,6-diaminopimelate ligase n=1 Tax=Novosphingobium ovatum TaxID=1908523 RepID=A0ABW9XE88_9SPHN|nr:UDP-N-acetylmuramoyl-L-alanyl-D-glutamate--2,6-diaminopimelate ligase [Novosphingobium ovatum]NBC36841.1 UDP-N-acetylmuramoyl-L-alanyl-D-glutamate--2,6-diaminopimelate ligase [Novosphingobium ovatum]